MTKDFMFAVIGVLFFVLGYATAEWKFEKNCNVTYPDSRAGCAMLAGSIFGWPWNHSWGRMWN